MGHASSGGAPDGPVPGSAARIEPDPRSLCACLRLATRDAHVAIERQLRLPDGVLTLDQYRDILRGFLGVHRPIERALLALPGWDATGVDPRPRMRTAEVEADLRALGVDPSGCPAGSVEDPLPGKSIAEALGALYVLEGSTLGGVVVARALHDRFGGAIAGATAFLAGRGARTGPMWRSFRIALDEYGAGHPEQVAAVIDGARATFAAHRRRLPTMTPGRPSRPASPRP